MSSEFVNVTESAHKVLGQGNFVLMMSVCTGYPFLKPEPAGTAVGQRHSKRILKEPNAGTLEFYRTRHTAETHSPFQ